MSKLNQSQLEAVNFEFGSLLVVAGAGTGKTSLVTERIIHLINEKNVKPNEILAVTFTEKAAREMVERLDEKMPLGYFEPKICTYHSFCLDVLKEDGQEMGLNTNFKLITDAEQWMILRKEIYKLNLKELRPKNNPGKYISDLLKLFSKCTDENVTSQDLLKYSLSLEDEKEKKKWEEAALIFDHYKEVKLRDSKMDFGDLITFVYDLFKTKPYVLKKYQERYKHVLVDEFQDTNYTQYEIIKLLCEKETLSQRSLVVVGDDSQSIYKFRGAAISNILEFKKDFDDPKIVTLNQNYRSVQQILDVSYDVIQNNNPYTLESTLGISKKLFANKKTESSNPAIEVINTPDLDTEVEFVINKIKELLNSDEYEYKDIAILARANSHLEPFILALRKEGLPYQFFGNRGLYDREEVNLVICLLNLLVNTSDSSNLFRCLFIDSLNIDVDTIYKLLNLSRDKKTLLWNECENYKFDKNLTSFVNTIKSYQRKLPSLVPSDLVYNLLTEIKYLNKYFAEETIENDLAVKNLDLFLKRVKSIEMSMFQDSGVTPNLLEFLEYFNLILEAGDNPAQAEVEDVDTINLLTVHSSKGLEYEVVFLPSLINGRFPAQDRHYGFDLPDELIEDKEILPNEDYFLQEERRLFYVGMTRAKKYLFMSHADTYGKRDRSKSTFLEESKLPVKRIESVKEVLDTHEQVSLFGPESDYRKKINKIDSEYLPKSLSFTALNTYKSCPLKYKYQYILNFPTKQSKALSFGNTIHEVLKEYHVAKLNRDVKLEEVIEMYKLKFQPFGYEDRENQIDYYKSGIELLTNYYNKYDGEKIKSVVIEKMFKFDMGGVPVSGKIDRIDMVGENEYEIIDYKTGEMKTEKEIRNDDQLTLYAEAAKEFFNFKKVKLTYFYIEHDKKVTTERDENDVSRLKLEVKEVFENIRNKNFKATPSQRNCMFCDFKDICPSAIKD